MMLSLFQYFYMQLSSFWKAVWSFRINSYTLQWSFSKYRRLQKSINVSIQVIDDINWSAANIGATGNSGSTGRLGHKMLPVFLGLKATPEIQVIKVQQEIPVSLHQLDLLVKLVLLVKETPAKLVGLVKQEPLVLLEKQVQHKSW